MKTDAVEGELLETVKLIMPHTHAGIDYAIGETIDVTASEKAWLENNHIIESPKGE